MTLTLLNDQERLDQTKPKTHELILKVEKVIDFVCKKVLCQNKEVILTNYLKPKIFSFELMFMTIIDAKRRAIHPLPVMRGRKPRPGAMFSTSGKGEN